MPRGVSSAPQGRTELQGCLLSRQCLISGAIFPIRAATQGPRAPEGGGLLAHLGFAAVKARVDLLDLSHDDGCVCKVGQSIDAVPLRVDVGQLPLWLNHHGRPINGGVRVRVNSVVLRRVGVMAGEQLVTLARPGQWRSTRKQLLPQSDFQPDRSRPASICLTFLHHMNSRKNRGWRLMPLPLEMTCTAGEGRRSSATSSSCPFKNCEALIETLPHSCLGSPHDHSCRPSHRLKLPSQRH